MKRLVFILLFIFTLVPIVLGQSRPSSVDHSAKFGPAVVQYGNGCQVFSLAYLKSYIWNDKLNRNPMLPENQFSGYALWNQSISIAQHYGVADGAFYLMFNQGAVTVDKFSQPIDMELLPGLEARENGLKYRSKKLISDNTNYPGGSDAFLNRMKDSLNKGTCFTLSFPLFNYINQLYNTPNAVYVCPQGISRDSMYASHLAVVVGYDDNIVTANGKKGAFKMLNSWGSQFGNQGYFYFDYRWITETVSWWAYGSYFLEEDFSYFPELAMTIDISNMVTGEDIDYRKNIFVDSVHSFYYNPRFDYDSDDYFYYSRSLKIKKVNNQTIGSPGAIIDMEINRTPDAIFLPRHNHDGNRQVLVDLTDYVKANDFKSLELLVVDPVSASYVGENGNVIYSYVREAKASINEAYIKILGTNKRIVGKVVDLSDTTIVSHDFDSYPAAFHLSPPSGNPIHIKVCTSVLRRKLITFRIEDISTINYPPVYINIPKDTLKAETGSVIEYKFEAADPDGDQLKYSLAQAEIGASIDSATGLFKFHSDQPVKKQLKVIVTDGYNNVVGEFALEMFTTVGVEDELGLPKEYSLSQNYPNPFNPATAIHFSIAKSGFVTLKVYNLLGQEVAVLVNEELNAGAYNTKFDASNLASGIYIYSLKTREYSSSKKMILTK